MIDNVHLIKENPQVFAVRAGFYSLCGMIFLSVMFFWPIRALLRKLRRKDTANKPAVPVRIPTSRWLGWAGILATLTSIFALICLALIAIAPNLILVIGMTLLATLALRRSPWAGAIHWYFLAVGLALLAFNGVLFI
jgi:hypothetical protein